MPVPYTKLYLSTVLTSATGGYRLTANAAGDLSQTILSYPVAPWVSGLADINGDGIGETVVGGPGDDDRLANAGRIYVNFGHAVGGTSSVLPDSINGMIIDGVNAGDLAGGAVSSISDLNGDGHADILVGAPGVDKAALADAGAAFVIWGISAGGGVDLADPFSGGGGGYVIKGEAAGDQAGVSIASIADMSGDTRAEVLVGASGSDAGGTDSGAAYVVWGKATDTIVNLTSVAAGTGGFRIVGQAAGDAAGQLVGSVHDLNGDGHADILVGAAGNDAGGANAGAVYVVYNKSTTTAVSLNSVASGVGGFRITGQAGDAIGTAFADIGDVNGDGLSDILIGSSVSDRAYVVFGKTNSTEVRLSDVAAGTGGFMILAEAPGDLANLSVTGGYDFNRDGMSDLVIGTPHNAEGGVNAGAVYVVWGGVLSTVDLSVVAGGMGGAKIVGNAGSLAGSSVAVLNDMNGDGTSDLLIGSPGAGESVGVVYAAATWQPDFNIYGTNNADVMAVGYGGLHKIGAGDDSILGLDGNDTISGGLGNDSIDGGTGADSMTGGGGNDSYYVDDFGDSTVELAAEGTDTVIAAVDWTLGANVENLTLDGFGLSGTGNSLANTLTGSDGGDSLDGAGGNDTMIGGLGDDIYFVDAAGDVAQEDVGGGIDTVVSTRNWVLGANLENLILTGSAATATGNVLDNTLTGTGGNNTLNGMAGADLMIGGLGNDTYRVDNAGDTIQEDAAAGTDTVIATVDYVLSAEVENLLLSGTAHTGTGNALANSLTGTSGADSLNGMAGADTMTGGAGNDTYYVDSLADQATEAAGGGTDTVISTIDGYVLAANVETLTLSGAARLGTGNALGNTINGTGGNDTIDGGAGADTMVGGAGNDIYYVDSTLDQTTEGTDAGTDTVHAFVDYTMAANIENIVLEGTAHSGTGNGLDNALTGGTGADTLNGLEGNDTLDGAAGADTMDGGNGNDTYYVDNPGDVIVEAVGGGTDTVVVSGDWTLSAGSNIENVRATTSGHILTGNDGANTLSGSSGDDTLDGGAGDDTELGGDGNDHLISTSGHDALSGGSGNDVYEVHGGSVTIEDFLGHDTIDAHDATGDSHIDLSGETQSEIENQTCDLGQGGTTVAPLDVQFLQDLTGSFGDDIANVRTLVPAIVAALQAAQPDSEFGVSSFIDKAVSPFGASGEWVYQLELALTKNVASLSTTYNTITTHSGADTPECQIESLMHLALTAAEVGFRADSARFVIVFTDAPFHVAGDGAAGGITTPNNGDAVLDGVFPGTGEDYPFVSQLTSALQAANIIPIFAVTSDVTTYYDGLVTQLGRGATVTLTANSSNVVAAVTGGLTAVTHTVIEDANGGVGNDTLIGNDVNNTLTGNGGNDNLSGRAGDDVLQGGAGIDTMTGGLGNDTFVVDNAADVAAENVGEGTDVVQASLTYTLGANIEGLILTGVGYTIGTGNDLDNTLTGSSVANSLRGMVGNDFIDGGLGADRMYGGIGDDTYIVDNTGDLIVENVGEGTDSVQATVSYSLAANVENLTLAGSDNLNGNGSAIANTLTGNSGNNRLDGKAGADTMAGGLGNDTYVVDVVGDVVTELAGQGVDTIETTLNFTLGANMENLTLLGAGNRNGIGNELDNVLIGNSGANALKGLVGNDFLNGGSGADRMYGGIGDDTYVVDNTADLVSENAAEGIDTVQTALDYTLGANLENLTLTGAANKNGLGNTLNNVLTGNSGNNTLKGLDGVDTLDGKGGADILFGGLGADTFVFGLGSGADVIRDFQASESDLINVNAYTHGVAFDAGVTITADGFGNAIIDLGGGNVITVAGSSVPDVSAHMVW